MRRVLLLHNRYRWAGGEDETFRAEADLLRAHGHEVIEEVVDNEAVLARGRLATLAALWRGAWNFESRARVRARIEAVRPDVMHVHNFWFRLSPSVLGAGRAAGVPTVLRLPNFRLLCLAGVLQDPAGAACTRCVGRMPWPGIRRRCYHRSLLASALLMRMLLVNRWSGTWRRDVDLFLAPSEFSRAQYIRGGFSAGRIAVKPNFVTDPYDGRETVPESPAGEARVLFVGRLSAEKGLPTLLRAWRMRTAAGGRLRIVGDGPLRREVEAASAGADVDVLGPLDREGVAAELSRCACLVLPSECYETFGRVVIEAYAHGRPVLVSRRGGPAELVVEGRTGRTFLPGAAEHLAAGLDALLADPEARRRMGRAARKRYLREYTPERNYRMLLECYERAAANRVSRRAPYPGR